MFCLIFVYNTHIRNMWSYRADTMLEIMFYNISLLCHVSRNINRHSLSKIHQLIIPKPIPLSWLVRNTRTTWYIDDKWNSWKFFLKKQTNKKMIIKSIILPSSMKTLKIIRTYLHKTNSMSSTRFKNWHIEELNIGSSHDLTNKKG